MNMQTWQKSKSFNELYVQCHLRIYELSKLNYSKLICMQYSKLKVWAAKELYMETYVLLT